MCLLLFQYYIAILCSLTLPEMKRSVEKRPSWSQKKINILDIKVRCTFRHWLPIIETNLFQSIYLCFQIMFTCFAVVINGFETRGVNFVKFAFMRLKPSVRQQRHDISCLTTLRRKRPAFHFRPLFTKMIN